MMTLFGRLSLQTKLLLSFIIIIVLATSIGYLFIDSSVKRAFSDFTVRSFTLQDQILLELIIGYYQRTGSFDRVIEILKQSPHEIPILLVDPTGKVVYSPDERYLGRRLSEEQIRDGEPIVLPDGEVWTFVPYRASPLRAALQEGFLRTTRRALILAGCAAAAAGIVNELPDPATGRNHEAWPTLVLGHVVTSIRRGDDYVFIDPSFGHFFYNRDNTDLATAREMAADVELVTRVVKGSKRLANYARTDTQVRLEEGTVVWPAGAPPK